jgi:hypothetical protein
MKFQCPYCLHARFVPAPRRTDEVVCLWCGHESKVAAPESPNPNKLAGSQDQSN